MDKEIVTSRFNRRTTIKAAAGGLFAGLGGLFFATRSDPVMAASISISNETITTDDGTISDILVSLDVDVSYDGAEVAPGSTDVTLKVQESGENNGFSQIGTVKNQELSGTNGTATYSFDSVSILSTRDKSTFQADTDGSETSKTFNFQVVITATGDINGDGNNPDSTTIETGNTKLTVSNEPSSTSASGSGSLNAKE